MSDEIIEANTMIYLQGENQCVRKQFGVAAVKEFAESVKMAFYHEFEELIPSIMADKIDELVKKVCGNGD